ncbi:DEAD/DEAH box helicase [Microbacterium kyungheense]|uniref:SWIM zinc finger protein n=1 Tax=Microbacterium kyungheense TaxID=1263636 RepID=A0A543F398_9MICO|nr:DEAD/DEAH box helicase [Microbacterium kyungheense]TQM28307.1 SWIM zinc finger protein [Microbacterium kyungheense]
MTPPNAAPPFIDPAHIRRFTDGGTYERGVAYFADGAVQQLTWDPFTSVLEASVAGSGRDAYRCRIRLDPQRTDRPIAATSCTCPVQFDCKHTVAVLLAANRLARQAPAASSETAWRSVFAPAVAPVHDRTPLALGVELRQRVRRGTSNWAPARIETATARGLHQFGADVLVGLRPLQRSGRSAAWIKGGVSWDALRRPSTAFDPAQARWFAELHSIGRDVRSFGAFSDVSEWLTLDDIESSLLWPHLAAAADRGIPVVPTRRGTTVALAETASVSVQARRTGGGVEVAPVVVLDGERIAAAELRPVGRTGLYRFAVQHDRIDLLLAEVALPDPVPALLAAREAVTVPPDDAAEFVRDHLPRLARRVEVAAPGIEVAPAAPPRLLVSARFDEGHRIVFTVAWRYGGALVGLDGSGERDGAPGLLDDDRDPAAELAIRDRVEALWHEASPVGFTAAGTLTGLDSAEFSAVLLPLLEADPDVDVELSGERPRYRELAGDPRIEISTVETADADWFDLGVVVSIDGRTIPFGTLFTALSRGRKRIMLSDGAYFSLSHPALQRLRDLIDEAGELDEWETGPRISRYQTALWADFEDLADEAQPAVSWRATVEALRDVDSVPSTPLPSGLDAELRPYQRTGFEWLAFLWQHRLGGILADDMGLGKTLQLLALVAHAVEQDERRPFLVVAPTSVLSTWRTEAARFTPGLRVAVVDATRRKRGMTVAQAAASADLVVTSYTLLRLDEAEFAAVEWAGLILDEAQFVKNSQTKVYRAARDLSADVVFAITGTPMENSLTELWALLSLTAPGLFASARRFREEYVGPIEKGKVPENQEGGEYRAGRLARLRRRIRPLVLRRTKELVAADLPPKQEQEVRIELGAAHRALYDTVLQRERQKVLGLLDDLDRNRFIVFRSLTLLRMLALAPELVDPAHAHIAPSKLGAMFEQLDEILAEGHRALVFSQFTSFLGLAAAELEARGIPYAYLDGSTRGRDAAVAAFRGGAAPVFLISLKAGGFGLTLTEADYVFLLDPWWNPAAEAQAVDRAHRIGQDRSVMVYRLIANGTIEEKVMALQQRKARLFRAVMDDDALFGRALTADDIRGLFDG